MVNSTQVFGNNEYYKKWLDFIETQNIDVDFEFWYEGEITDIMTAISVIEEIVADIENEKHRTKSLYDLAFIKENQEKHKNAHYGKSLLDEIINEVNSGYLFLPYCFLQACRDSIEPDKPYADGKHLHCYKIKENKTIKIKAS